MRSEHGWPRKMTATERARFMRQMSEAEAGVAAADPFAPVTAIADTRERPDSLVARGKSQKITITMPRAYREDGKYPLVVDLDDTAGADDGAFVVHRKADVTGKWLVATGAEIATFMTTKYPVDPARVRVTEDPAMGVRAAQPVTPKPVVVAAAVPASGTGVMISRPGADGLRWVRHRHHHELDYPIDADGKRVQ